METRKENVAGGIELYSPPTIRLLLRGLNLAFSKSLDIMTFMVLIPTSCFVYHSLLGSLGTLINGCIYKSLASGGNLLMYKQLY